MKKWFLTKMIEIPSIAPLKSFMRRPLTRKVCTTDSVAILRRTHKWGKKFHLTKQLSLENIPFRPTCAGTTHSSTVVVLGFTMLLTSQVISVNFYNEREKSEKLLRGSNFCFVLLRPKFYDMGPTALLPFRRKEFLHSENIHWPRPVWNREPRIQCSG